MIGMILFPAFVLSLVGSFSFNDKPCSPKINEYIYIYILRDLYTIIFGVLLELGQFLLLFSIVEN